MWVSGACLLQFVQYTVLLLHYLIHYVGLSCSGFLKCRTHFFTVILFNNWIEFISSKMIREHLNMHLFHQEFQKAHSYSSELNRKY